LFAVPTKVKKTDLPVIPPESEILPSLDDSDDSFSDDLDDDDIEGKAESKETEKGQQNVNN
jgi:amyloid beta A4 protein